MTVDIQQHQFLSPLFESVVKQAIQFFLDTPIESLPPDDLFQGVGVYGIYLMEHDSLYRNIADPTLKKPIYVGKAVPVGWRTARINELSRGTELYGRLRQHARSIDHANNLNVAAFRCRFMILNGIESDLIVPIEAELIRHFKPLWNTTVDGFGNHDPGSGRYNQARSEWDVVHPGRPWAEKLTGVTPELEYIAAKIDAYIKNSNA
jgi:hypothetical protein